MKKDKQQNKAAPEETRQPDKPAGKHPFRVIALIVIVLTLGAGAVAAGFFGYIYYTDHIRQDTDDAGLYLWEGEYIDTVGYQTSMSITPGDRNGFYKISICMGEADSRDLIFWDITAFYNKETNSLVYSDAVREDWIHPEAEDGSEGDDLIRETVYVNGTGSLSVEHGLVSWKDAKEDFGKGMVFEKSSSTVK